MAYDADAVSLREPRLKPALSSAGSCTSGQRCTNLNFARL